MVGPTKFRRVAHAQIGRHERRGAPAQAALPRGVNSVIRKIYLGAALSAVGCSGAFDTSAAEQATVHFHELLDHGDFAEIYDETSDEFKKATAKDEFAGLLSAVHRKLGNTRSSTKQTWRTNVTTSGTFIVLTYQTTFDEGAGAEQFTFKKTDTAVAMVGYHINSNELILK